jgi:hypothetical protein
MIQVTSVALIPAEVDAPFPPPAVTSPNPDSFVSPGGLQGAVAGPLEWGPRGSPGTRRKRGSIKQHGDDEELIAEAFLREYELEPRRFSKAEKAKTKTPDYRVLVADQFAFFCEVKSTSDIWLETELEHLKSGEMISQLTCDSAFNRIAGHIEKAVDQFDAVNAGLAYPNVLVFVNNDQSSGFGDLFSTLTGDFVAEDGSRDHIYGNVSDGRIARPKLRVHLYWWVDTWDSRRQYFLNRGHQAHAEWLSRLFRLDPGQTKQV